MRDLIFMAVAILLISVVSGQILQHPKNRTGREGLKVQLVEGDGVETAFPASKYVVDDDGMITMWKIGKVQTKGKTHDVLAKEIELAYEKTKIYKDPKVVVSGVSAASEGPWDLFAVSDSWLSDLYQAKTAQQVSSPRNVSLRDLVRGCGEISGYGAFGSVRLHRNGQVYRYDLEIGKDQGVKLHPSDLLQVVPRGGGGGGGGGKTEPRGVDSWEEVQLTVTGVPDAGQRRINGTYKVAEDGTIMMWKIGKVDTKGKTADQFAVDLRESYVKADIYENPVFIVSGQPLVKKQMGGNFIAFMAWESGDMRLSWTEGVTIESVVKSAGWDTKRRYSNWVKLYRGENVYAYNLLLESHQRIKIYPRDVIEVFDKAEGRVSLGEGERG